MTRKMLHCVTSFYGATNLNKHRDSWVIALISKHLGTQGYLFFPREEDFASFAFAQNKMKLEVTFHAVACRYLSSHFYLFRDTSTLIRKIMQSEICGNYNEYSSSSSLPITAIILGEKGWLNRTLKDNTWFKPRYLLTLYKASQH